MMPSFNKKDMEQRMDERKERLQKFTKSNNVIDNHVSRYYISRRESKLGEGRNNIVVGPDSIQTNNESSANPGFTITGRESELRLGNQCDVNLEVNKLRFGGGSYTFNPLLKFLNPSAVTNLEIFIQVTPMNDLAAFKNIIKPLQELFGAFNG